MLTSRDSATETAGATGRTRTRWRWWGWLPDVAVLMVLVLAVLSYHYDLGTRLGLAPDPRTEPAQVAVPEGLRLPAAAAPAQVAAAQSADQADPAKVRAAVAGLVADPKLGPHVRLLVAGLDDGKTLTDIGTGAITPASTTKLLTSTAALATLGPQTRFDTTVVQGAGNRIVLVGGGDPFLVFKPEKAGTYPHRADLRTLARQTAAALKAEGRSRVRLGYDDSAFTGPSFNPAWPADYAGGVVPPISALWVDEGHSPTGGFLSDPSQAAAQVFSDALVAAGVQVKGTAAHVTAPTDAKQLSAVQSPTVGEIVARLLLVSDNNAAEVMARHVGQKVGDDPSFTGGVAAVRKTLTGLGVPLEGDTWFDGSGLSRKNQLTPQTLVGVLRAAASPDHPTLRQVITGLPVAGFSGSLEYRFDQGYPTARGRVAAKTGTLTGVHGLAGVATDADGDVLAFAVVADQVAEPDQSYAQDQLDKIAGALGSCACR